MTAGGGGFRDDGSIRGTLRPGVGSFMAADRKRSRMATETIEEASAVLLNAYRETIEGV